MSAAKRIPVSGETRDELHNLEQPGQTYDELLTDLARLRRRKDLEQRSVDLEERDRDDLTPLDDVYICGVTENRGESLALPGRG